MLRKKVNIIYLRDPGSLKFFWETDWLHELFESDSNLEIQHIVELKREKIFENPVIIINKPIDSMTYIKKYIDAKKEFSLIQLSDEGYGFNINIYKHPLCKHIFRNHYHIHLSKVMNKVTYFGLGYKMGLWDNYNEKNPKNITNIERDYIWSFCGDLGKSGRENVIKSIKKFGPNYLYTIDSWNSSKSLTATDYRDVMLKSIFIPCLIGYVNVDTFRFYEALECGCIPIIYRWQKCQGKPYYDYYEKLLGKNPIPYIENWGDLPKLIEDLLSDEEMLEQKRVEIYDWWIDNKNNKRIEFNRILSEISK